MIRRSVVILSATLFLASCATPEVVNIRKVGDDQLSCNQIKEQFLEAQDFEKRAEQEKGATGTNVAAGIFFWPALLATYQNIEEAKTAARDRQAHLAEIAEEKNCPL